MKYLKKIIFLTVPTYTLLSELYKHPTLINKKSFVAEIFYRFIPLTFFFVWLFDFITHVGSIVYILLMLMGGYFIFIDAPSKIKYHQVLGYFIVMNIGFLGIRSFVGHTFLNDVVANSIGWETSPFQTELAFYHLGLAVVAIGYLWKQSLDIALALVICKSVFWYGAMGVHIYELVINNNTNIGNIGINIIYADLILPSIMLYVLYKAWQQTIP